MNKSTPGPWEWHYHGTELRAAYFATEEEPLGRLVLGNVTDTDGSSMLDAPNHADYALIKAAPDLNGLLEELVIYVEGRIGAFSVSPEDELVGDGILKRSRAALLKARPK